MSRRIINFFLIVAICVSGFSIAHALKADDSKNNIQINTPEQAAEFASKLANEKCQISFGKSPFAPDSYSAQFTGSRWCWGKIEPPGIGGYSAEVEFNTDGSDQKVRTVLHTDGMRIYRNSDISDVPIKKKP